MSKLFSTLSSLNPKSLKNLSDQVLVLIETKLWAKVLAGMALGILVGLLMSPTGALGRYLQGYASSVDTIMVWMALPAQFFLKLIKMVIIPLIISSIIRGLASTTDVNQMKKLGFKFSLFVFANSILAAILGIIITKSLKPGSGLLLSPTGSIPAVGKSTQGMFTLSPESILNFLPTNPLSSIVEGQMLDVVILSIIAGVALLSIRREQAKGVVDALEVIQQVCMKIISWAMRLAPYAVFGMMAQVTFSTGVKSLENMFLYVICCFIGFAVLICFYLFLIWIIKRQSPIVFLKKISTALLLAFSTSSSAATMPVTMKVAEEDLHITPSIVRFTIPLGATINMAGSAIWHTSAVIFISQMYQIELSFFQISFVVATSISSAIGSPGVPGVGVGILATILAKIGVPLEGVSLILGVDRIIDMGCTAVNVAGDLTISSLLDTNPVKDDINHAFGSS